MLESHYAPRARLRLNADAPNPDEVYLGFGARDHGPLNLSHNGDLVEAAGNLYAHLRALDGAETRVIAVAPIPHAGLGEAINDRLERAAVR
jgi:L-threonylcarbamoyladenylate synthase